MIGEFHHEVGLTFVFIEGIDVDDVRVVQAGQARGLRDKILHRKGILHLLLLDEFHGHQPFQDRIEGAIDRAVTARGNDAA